MQWTLATFGVLLLVLKQILKMQKKIFLLSVILVAGIHTGFSQPSIQWQHSYGGSGEDIAFAIQQTVDGGYVFTGRCSSADGDITGNQGWEDCWVVKTDDLGNIQWQKSLGGSGNDLAFSIQQCTDGGFIVGAISGSNDGDVTGNHGDLDFWVVKLDGNGNLVWQKSLGGSEPDRAYSIQQTADNGFIVAGSSNSNDFDVTGHHGTVYESDFWIVKLDSTGSLQWQKSLGGSSYDAAESVKQTADGGYIIAGSTYSNDGDIPTGSPHGYSDYWVVKLDAAGNLLWQIPLGGTNNDLAHSVSLTADGGCIVAGRAASVNGNVTGNNGAEDAWLVKLSSSGSVQWLKCYGGSDFDWARSVQQTTDGGYVIAGFAASTDSNVTGNHGASDYWTIKTDSAGNIIWQQCYGGTGAEIAYAVQQTADGGYVAAGYSGSVNGDVTGNHGGWDYWVVKLSAVTGIDDAPVQSGITVFPNPASDHVVVNFPGIKNGVVQLFNLTGEKVFEDDEWNGQQMEINVHKLPACIYILKFYSGEIQHIQKLVIQH